MFTCLSCCGVQGKHISTREWTSTQRGRSPSSEYPPSLPPPSAGVLSTVISLLATLPGDTDRGEQCLFLFWMPMADAFPLCCCSTFTFPEWVLGNQSMIRGDCHFHSCHSWSPEDGPTYSHLSSSATSRSTFWGFFENISTTFGRIAIRFEADIRTVLRMIP